MPAWTAPERADVPYDADERTLLEAFLDFHRDTLLVKCAGLTGEQLAERSVAPSGLSLHGLLRHLAEVERYWFRDGWQGDVDNLHSTAGNPDADFDDTEPARAEEDLATYRSEVAAAREEAARHGLDGTVEKVRGGRPTSVSLRWIYIHMIEEYARHNGHADLLRERIDGATGE
jgi:uncharacterized damage-inducible protein DinB